MIWNTVREWYKNELWWLSWLGLAQHQAVSSGVTILAGLLGASPLVIAVMLLIAGLYHEQAQQDLVTYQWWSDFRKKNGGPYNGTLDVISFVPLPLWVFVYAGEWL